MFSKYVFHACMNKHIFEHVYGEEPFMSKRKNDHEPENVPV